MKMKLLSSKSIFPEWSSCSVFMESSSADLIVTY